MICVVNFPDFMPTFKFFEGRAEYVLNRAKKLPSYTDRVIFREKNDPQSPGQVNVELYTSLKIHLSDHQPVIFAGTIAKK